MEGKRIRQQEKDKDKSLHISTGGLREWKNKHLYNRTESTPYRSLEALFNELKLKSDDVFVDFGSGKGRVVFYLNSLYDCYIKGIEAKPTTYDDAILNLERYSNNLNSYNNKIEFYFTTAENYDVDKSDNHFYFFNPFSVVIFKKVISNILKSYKENPREITLIIFYTIEEYREFIQNHTPFKLTSRIKTPNQSDKYQQFLIYKLIP